MVLERTGPIGPDSEPLVPREVPDPVPGRGEVLLEVLACGVCHTELDEIEGRARPDLPRILGHQVVARVLEVGPGVARERLGERVGVAWIAGACAACSACDRGFENLCDQFRATGLDVDGGYAELMVAASGSALPLPEGLGDLDAAPLLCAGAIGYRSLRLTGLEQRGRLGLTGFGASAHLVLSLVRATRPGLEVYVFARSSQQRRQASELGAVWTGDTDDPPPARLDAIIDTTPAWAPLVAALAALRPGGRLVVNAIRKEEADRGALQNLDWARHLWLEKEIKSVANVTRRDVEELLTLAARVDLVPELTIYPLAAANRALVELAQGGQRGAKVLVP